MSHEAELLGIDLVELERERFSHPDHGVLLRVHDARVRAWGLLSNRSEFERDADDRRAALKALAVADELIVKQRRKEARRKARETRKRRASYSFTERQLEIALGGGPGGS